VRSEKVLRRIKKVNRRAGGSGRRSCPREGIHLLQEKIASESRKRTKKEGGWGKGG